MFCGDLKGLFKCIYWPSLSLEPCTMTLRHTLNHVYSRFAQNDKQTHKCAVFLCIGVCVWQEREENFEKKSRWRNLRLKVCVAVKIESWRKEDYFVAIKAWMSTTYSSINWPFAIALFFVATLWLVGIFFSVNVFLNPLFKTPLKDLSGVFLFLELLIMLLVIFSRKIGGNSMDFR